MKQFEAIVRFLAVEMVYFPFPKVKSKKKAQHFTNISKTELGNLTLANLRYFSILCNVMSQKCDKKG